MGHGDGEVDRPAARRDGDGGAAGESPGFAGQPPPQRTLQFTDRRRRTAAPSVHRSCPSRFEAAPVGVLSRRRFAGRAGSGGSCSQFASCFSLAGHAGREQASTRTTNAASRQCAGCLACHPIRCGVDASQLDHRRPRRALRCSISFEAPCRRHRRRLFPVFCQCVCPRSLRFPLSREQAGVGRLQQREESLAAEGLGDEGRRLSRHTHQRRRTSRQADHARTAAQQ